MLYANVYEYKGVLGEHQFVGNLHYRRGDAEFAAAEELRVEHNTRRIGVLRIKPKATA